MATAPRLPAHRPLNEHLARTAVAGVGVYLVVALVVAALVASRATAHVITPAALAAVAAGAAAALAFMGWPQGMYDGAAEVLRGESVLDCEPGCRYEPTHDPWTAPRLWWSALAWSALAAVWAAAGAGLIAVALDGKRARLVVVFVALAGLAGVGAVVVDAVARQRGAHAARRLRTHPGGAVPLRRRAWRQVALPLALYQGIANLAMSWVLFHDYARVSPDGVATRTALTSSVALADVLVMVVLLTALFGNRAAVWGRADAELGRVSLDDAANQDVPAKAPLGWQGLVYLALVALFASKLFDYVLPSRPNLAEVAVVRAVFAMLLTYVVAGIAYSRGAVNGMNA